MPRRVLWVVKGLGPGGAEHLLAVAAELHDPAHVQLDCAYVLPHKDHLAGRLAAAGVHVHCVGGRGHGLLWPLRLARLVRDGRYDVVHVHSPLPGSVARLAVRSMARRRRPVVVATEHNSWGTFGWPSRWLNRLTSRWNDTTFAVSEEALRSITGSAARTAVSLVHGIDLAATRALRAERAAVRRELGIDDAAFVIGTVANFRGQKDHPNLLRAARLLLDRGVDVRWVVVGQGPLEPDIRSLAHELDLEGAVQFTGYRSDATRIMSAFDVFTLASSWEGLPVALMDALALGLPVVATAVGGVAETLHDGVNAVLVPAGDSAALADGWQSVVGDDVFRRRLSDAAETRALGFDARVALTTIEAAYGVDATMRHDAAPTRPAVSRPVPTGYDIRPAMLGDREAVLALLRSSMRRSDDPRFAELYAWKHDANPFGRSPTWVATKGNDLVGVRAFMRWEFVRGGATVRAVRAVDTATHPDHQGRGLFTALTMHALDELVADGVSFVFNTPNTQSLPGYLKMGWREVGRLPTALRPTGLAALPTSLRARVAAEHWSLPITVGQSLADWTTTHPTTTPVARHVRTLATNTTTEFLAWRYAGLADLDYRVVPHPTIEHGAIVVRARRRGSAIELVHAATFALSSTEADRLAVRTAREVGAHHAIRLGAANLAAAYLPVPNGGPLLAWRGLTDRGLPPLANWDLTMGDVELF